MAYEALASAYDALTYDIAYDDALRFMQQLLADAGLHPETVVDLACGTGSLSVRLAAQGYRVYGVDLSEEMLTQAAEKAMQMENPPYFVCQDMCKLELPEPVDWIVCMLDSVNYILDPADCAGMMRHVAECLKPGGMFIFDINTPEKLRALDGQVFLDETEDDYCVWRTEFDEQARISITASICLSAGARSGCAALRSISSTPIPRRSWSRPCVRRALRPSAPMLTGR